MAQKITQALIYQELMSIKETLHQHSKQDNENFQKLTQILEGSELTPGMKIRVDRLEQLEQVKKRHFGYVWSVLLLIASAVVTLISNAISSANP